MRSDSVGASLGELHFPSHVVVGPAMLLRPRVDVPSLLAQIHGATFVLLCSTLVLVTLAIAFACRPTVKNCPRTQLMTSLEAWCGRVNSSGSPFTTGATSLASALRAPSAVV